MTTPPAGPPYVNPTSLIAGTMVSTDLARARRMLEDCFDLACAQPADALLDARDKGHEPGGAQRDKPYWVLEIRKTDAILVEQEMLNHWGMAAPSEAAVDEAHARLSAAKAEYGVARVQKPRFRNGSYAFYFVDVDSNWWELEYRTPDITYDALRIRGDLFHD